EGEHAAQPLDQPVALLLVEVDEDLRVAVRAEVMAPGLEAGAEFLEVVDLAVEDDLDGAVLVAQRLGPPFQVDDRQSAVDEADAGLLPEPLAVGTAVGDGGSHGLEHTGGDRTGLVPEE